MTEGLLVICRLGCGLRRLLVLLRQLLLWRRSRGELLLRLLVLLTVPLLLLRVRLCVRLMLRRLRLLGLSIGGRGVGRRAGHALLVVLLMRMRGVVYAHGVGCFD